MRVSKGRPWGWNHAACTPQAAVGTIGTARPLPQSAAHCPHNPPQPHPAQKR